MKSNNWLPVTLQVDDAEQESLSVSFYYNQRSGSRKRRYALYPLVHRGNLSEGFEIQLPKEYGGIQVYAMVKDSYQNVGIATHSLFVLDDDAQARKYLVPRATFPFYVYEDGTDLPYLPTAYMGDYEGLEVDFKHKQEVKSGKYAIKIHYGAQSGWYGLGFVDPPGDWGTLLGGYDLQGAKELSFWAKASYKKLKINVGFGLIEDSEPYPDTDKKMTEIHLTDQWKKYTINLKKVDLSCIRSGFVLFASSEGLSHTIYLDNIVFN